MPSAFTDHVPISTISPRRDAHVDSSAVGDMDGATQESGDVVAAPAPADRPDRRSPSRKADDGAVAGGRATRPQTHSMDYIVRSGIAGGLAGCAAKTAVAPLDRVKILFQTSNPQFAKYTNSWTGLGRAMRDIYASQGVVRGLFRGHSATLLKIYPYAAIKFVAYEQYRAVLIGGRRSRETWLRRFAAGALAGVTSVFLTYPLEVVRVRLAFETKHRSSSLADICRKIYHEHPLPPPPSSTTKPSTAHASSVMAQPAAAVKSAAASTVEAVAAPRSGLVNFYRGFSTTMLGMVPYAGISFLTHDAAGDVLRGPALRRWTTLPSSSAASASTSTSTAPPPAGNKPAPLRAWAELLAGGLAGVVSQTASYPLEVVRRRMQVAGAVGDGHRLRIAETARMILRERGARGFFVGLSIGYVKILPMSAVSFYTYERVKTLFGI
ncbi:mitochondrial carrier protein LEU5 [Xylariaceae sp. FL0804]|nr:mitochondrial carrier protein LEU5 [Xylariaceae sp. FL0804]